MAEKHYLLLPKKLIVWVSIAILLLIVVIGIGNVSFFKSNLSGNQLHDQLQAIYNKIPTQSGKSNFLRQSNNLTKKVDPELVDLDSQIITCGATVDGLLSNSPSFAGSCTAGAGTVPSTKGMYLSGKCCGALTDTKVRHDNLKKLQAYKSMPNIILDPFHTSIALAKQWIDYDKGTTLNSDQQKIYDQAYAISKEKPCCCKCWHYYVNEGIAKKMIQDGTYNAQQIANYWDSSSICGI